MAPLNPATHKSHRGCGVGSSVPGHSGQGFGMMEMDLELPLRRTSQHEPPAPLQLVYSPSSSHLPILSRLVLAVKGRGARTTGALSILLVAALALGGAAGCNGETTLQPARGITLAAQESRTTPNAPPPSLLLPGEKGLIETSDLTDDSPLPRWLTFASGTRTFSSTLASLAIRVTAMDDSMPQMRSEATFALTADEVNDPPTTPALEAQTWTEGQENSYTVPEFTDPEGGTVTYTAVVLVDATTTALPSWLTFNEDTRTFRGTPQNADTPVDITIQVTATDDASPPLAASATFTLSVPDINQRPPAPSVSDQTAVIGRLFTYQFAAVTDPDGDTTLIYNVSLINGNPVSTTMWLTFDPDTRTFSGTPRVNVVSLNDPITIQVSVDDPGGLSGRDTFMVTVVANQAPSAPAIGPQSATEDVAFGYTVPEFDDPEGDMVAYMAVLATGTTLADGTTPADGTSLPDWLTFNATSRVLSGTPADAVTPATLMIRITAADDGTPAASSSVTFALNVREVNVAPVAVDDTISTAVDEGGTLEVQSSTLLDNDTDADVPANTLTITAVGNLSNSNSAAALSGDGTTVTYTHDGSETTSGGFTYTVSDGATSTPGTDTATVTVVVTPVNDAPVANAGPGQTVTPGSAVFLDGSGSSDAEDSTLTYTWSQTSGDNVTLSSTTVAMLTFTAPVVPQGQPSLTLDFSLVVSDGTVDSVADSVTITVLPPRVPGVPQSLSLTEGHRQVTVSWAAPSDVGNPALTGYSVQYREVSNPEVPWQTWMRPTTDVATSTTTVITGLTNGTAYQVRVAAVNSRGTGSYTAARSATPADVLRVPGVPQNLSLTEGHRQITVSWAAPSDMGNPALTSYSVQYREVSNPEVPWQTWMRPTTDVATSTATVITGLTNGTAYQVQVAAVNSRGTGSYTAAPSATPAVPISTPPPTSSEEQQRQQPDLSPDFGDNMVDDQVWSQDERVRLSLPVASGGDGELRYRLSPPLPSGLRFDADGRTISGTPTETLARTRFTFMARDQDGDRAELRFFITVTGLPPVDVPDPEDGASTLVVTRTGEASVPLTLGDEIMEVRVTADIESEGTRLTLQADPALESLAEVEFSAVTDTEVLGAEPPSGFRIAGSQTIVSITLMDGQGERIRELDNAVTVCLPVSDALLVEAGGQKLALLHYDETEGWTTLADSEVRTLEDGMMVVCAEATRFSPFAVGYGEEPTPTPMPTATATPTPSPTPTPVPSLTPTPEPIATPTPTATPIPTPTPTATLIPTPTPTLTVTPIPTPMPIPTATATPTPTTTTAPVTSPATSTAPVPEAREGGVSVWIWVVIGLVLASMAVVGAIVTLTRAWHRRG